jgi:NADH-quinone oxidoreductase subunit M
MFLFLSFTSVNLLWFFFFFECSIWPVFIYLLKYGSRQRKTHAAIYFFFFTVFGSILVFVGIVVLSLKVESLN